MEIRETRYRHTRELVAAYGGISAFAELLGKQQSQVSQFAGENPNKGIGNKIAREIEAACRLPPGYLDMPKPEWIGKTPVDGELSVSKSMLSSPTKSRLIDLLNRLESEGKLTDELASALYCVIEPHLTKGSGQGQLIRERLNRAGILPRK